MSETETQTAPDATGDTDLRAEAMIETSLDDILGADPDVPVDTSTDTGADKPADKPREDEGEEELAEAHSTIEEAKIKDAKAEEETDVDQEALTAALGALRRDNVPDDVIQGMLKDNPEKIIEWAGPVLERQSNIDKKMRGDPDTKADDTKEDTRADPTGTPATDSVLEELVRPFAGQMGSEHATETLVKLANHVREQTLAEVKPDMDYIKEAIMLMEVRGSRADLRERFPQIEDDETWKKILDRGDVLLKSGGYESFGSALEDATRLELGEQSTIDRQVETAKKHAKRSRGTPTAPTRVRKSTPSTPEELREKALDDILGPE